MTAVMPPILTVFERMDTDIPLTTRITVAAVSGLNDNFQTIFLALSISSGLLLVSSEVSSKSV